MLAVADLDRSVAFYRDRLGFTVREEGPGLALPPLQALSCWHLLRCGRRSYSNDELRKPTSCNPWASLLLVR
jgi:catechol 2,3-dioxygenase-like lactoylglutathione lyase family enzyme